MLKKCSTCEKWKDTSEFRKDKSKKDGFRNQCTDCRLKYEAILSKRKKEEREKIPIEYYPDLVCDCGCGGHIEKKPWHKYQGIPRFIKNHCSKSEKRRKQISDRNSRLRKNIDFDINMVVICGCGCGNKIPMKERYRTRGIPKFLPYHCYNTEEGRKKSSDAKKGKNNPQYGKKRELSANWKNGKSFEEYSYEFNDDLKDNVRKQYRYLCQICSKSQKDNVRKLDVHHIDYNKKNNFLHNLVPLCMTCHLKTNFNREYWTNYFQHRISTTQMFVGFIRNLDNNQFLKSA